MGDFSLTFVLSLYTAFVVFCAYAYGRHKGLQNTRIEALMGSKTLRAQMIEMSSKVWFVVSTFLIPWYLCFVWLFYSFDSVHYINAFNPWLLALTVIYAMYSVAVIASYSFFSNSDRCSKVSVRLSLCYAVAVAFLVLFILRENAEGFSVDGFHGDSLRHCVDLSAHRN